MLCFFSAGCSGFPDGATDNGGGVRLKMRVFALTPIGHYITFFKTIAQPHSYYFHGIQLLAISGSVVSDYDECWGVLACLAWGPFTVTSPSITALILGIDWLLVYLGKTVSRQKRWAVTVIRCPIGAFLDIVILMRYTAPISNILLIDIGSHVQCG